LVTLLIAVALALGLLGLASEPRISRCRSGSILFMIKNLCVWIDGVDAAYTNRVARYTNWMTDTSQAKPGSGAERSSERTGYLHKNHDCT
jgi:hypothetical protein